MRLRLFDLSVIIVNWNVRDLLRGCLRSLYDGPQGVTFEIFVVNNDSTDGSPEMMRREFPHVHLIQNVKNLGFARANNQAMKLSQGRYLLLLNPDTLILHDAVTKMVRFMDDHSEVGALGPKILTGEGQIDFRCARRFPSLGSELWEKTGLAARFPNNRLLGRHLMGDWDHEDCREVELLTGACLVVRREVIDQVGPLDEDFFLYGEDVDWCYRIKRAGWKIFYYPDAAIIHLGGQSSAPVQVELDMEALRSMNLFFRKDYGLLYALAHRAFMLIITLAKELFFLGKFFIAGGAERPRYWRKMRLHSRVLQWVFTDRYVSVSP